MKTLSIPSLHQRVSAIWSLLASGKIVHGYGSVWAVFVKFWPKRGRKIGTQSQARLRWKQQTAMSSKTQEKATWSLSKWLCLCLVFWVKRIVVTCDLSYMITSNNLEKRNPLGASMEWSCSQLTTEVCCLLKGHQPLQKKMLDKML